jgi:hypothetical protein
MQRQQVWVLLVVGAAASHSTLQQQLKRPLEAARHYLPQQQQQQQQEEEEVQLCGAAVGPLQAGALPLRAQRCSWHQQLQPSDAKMHLQAANGAAQQTLQTLMGSLLEKVVQERQQQQQQQQQQHQQQLTVLHPGVLAASGQGGAVKQLVNQVTKISLR